MTNNALPSTPPETPPSGGSDDAYSSEHNISHDVLLALRKNKIELWHPPYYNDGKRDLDALGQLAADLAENPDDEDEVLLALFEYQARSVKKHGGNISMQPPTPAALPPVAVARTVPPRCHNNEPAVSDIAKSAPPTIHHYSPPLPNTVVISPSANPEPSPSAFLAKPSQPLREPADGCTKCVVITMIVFDSIALVFWLSQWFLVGLGSAMSIGAFVIAAILSCVLPCTKQGGNKSCCVCTTHILGLLSWFGGIAMLIASGFSFFTDTELENQILYGGLAIGGITLISLTCVIMIFAVSYAGCVLCEVNRDHGDYRGEGGCCC